MTQRETLKVVAKIADAQYRIEGDYGGKVEALEQISAICHDALTEPKRNFERFQKESEMAEAYQRETGKPLIANEMYQDYLDWLFDRCPHFNPETLDEVLESLEGYALAELPDTHLDCMRDFCKRIKDAVKRQS